MHTHIKMQCTSGVYVYHGIRIVKMIIHREIEKTHTHAHTQHVPCISAIETVDLLSTLLCLSVPVPLSSAHICARLSLCSSPSLLCLHTAQSAPTQCRSR
jgi:hypothetical protein